MKTVRLSISGVTALILLFVMIGTVSAGADKSDNTRDTIYAQSAPVNAADPALLEELATAREAGDTAKVDELLDILYPERKAALSAECTATLQYLYDPSADGGDTVNWEAEVIIADDMNTANNSENASSSVVPCRQ